MYSIRSTASVSRVIRRSLNPQAAFSAARSYAQGYGDGAGGPKSEDPQAQGANPSEHLEHPGPPPPSEGQGSGAATKAKGGNGSSTSSSGSKDSGPQPKIHDERDGPKAGGQSVEEHNRDMANRHGKEASEKIG